MNLYEMKTDTAERDEGYDNTMAALKSAETALPAYTGSYDAEIKSIYDKIVKRPAFTYEASADPVYRDYKESYQRRGRLAMKDTVAQAADLTGGYSSSYAQSVGQQQYGAYLEKLSQLMPELYSAAYQRYQDEGDRLNARLSAASQLAGMEYERYTDGQDRSFQQEKFGHEQDKFAHQQKMDAYDNLASAISTAGYVPSEEELELAGMSAERAEALRKEYQRRYAPGSGGGGGGGGGGRSSSSTKKTAASTASSLEKLKIAKNK